MLHVTQPLAAQICQEIGDIHVQLAIVAQRRRHGEPLHPPAAEAGPGATTASSEVHETLQAGAVVGELSDAVERRIHDSLAKSVVPTWLLRPTLLRNRLQDRSQIGWPLREPLPLQQPLPLPLPVPLLLEPLPLLLDPLPLPVPLLLEPPLMLLLEPLPLPVPLLLDPLPLQQPLPLPLPVPLLLEPQPLPVPLPMPLLLDPQPPLRARAVRCTKPQPLLLLQEPLL